MYIVFANENYRIVIKQPTESNNCKGLLISKK